MSIQAEKDIVGFTSLYLRVSRIGERVTMDGSVINELKGEDAGTKVDRKKIRVQKEIIPKTALSHINAHEAGFRVLYNLRTKPGLQPGSRRPRGDLSEVVQMVEAFTTERANLAEEFANRFPEIRESAEKEQGPLFDPADYDLSREEIVSKFKVHLLVLQSGIPADLHPDLRKKLSDELDKQLSEADLAGLKEKRETFLKGTSTLLEELQKGKRIYQSVILGLERFCVTYRESDDPELAPLVAGVWSVIQGKTADDLRNFKGDLEKVRDTLAKIVPAVSELNSLLDVV